ncbi:MAG: transcriptional repressor [Bacteroidia bacterium]
MTRTDHLLRQHALRRTSHRVAILDVFVSHDKALGEREIEIKLDQSCDRVTIYRTLSTFLDKGLIHRVPDDSGALKFALCAPGCHEAQQHRHDHVHFKCLICERTTCVDQVRIPIVHLPQGYLLQEVDMLLKGRCPECSAKG